MIFLDLILLFIRNNIQVNNQIITPAMDSYYLPFFYAYYPPYPYFDSDFNQFAPLFQPSLNFQEYTPKEKLQNCESFSMQDEEKSSALNLRKRSIKKAVKNEEFKPQSKKTHRNRLQFSQRQQTLNRNLRSNTLKVYFKQLRDPKTETSQNIYKIIEENKIAMTHHKFIKRVNSMFSPTSTYISFDQLKKKLEFCSEEEGQLSFRKILRISIRRFFQYQIFTVNFKSARTTRKIRNQQIKQGKAILRDLSL